MTSVEDMLWKGWGKMLVRDTSAYKNKYTWVFFIITCIFKCGGISFLTFQSSDRPLYQLRWEEKESFFLIIHEQMICMAQTNESVSICLGKTIRLAREAGRSEEQVCFFRLKSSEPDKRLAQIKRTEELARGLQRHHPLTT